MFVELPSVAAAPLRLSYHELCLADWPECLGPVSAVAGSTLDEHRGDDVVPAPEIRNKILHEVAVVRPVPQVMMRIADRAFRLDDRLARSA